MPYRYISPDLKECTLRLWELGWTKELIVESLAISQASLYRWNDIFLEYGNVAHPPESYNPRGCHRILTRSILTAIKDVYRAEADTYLDELCWWLAVEHDIVISTSALQENLREAGLTWKLLHKIAHEQDEALQMEFRATDHDTAYWYGYAMQGEHADFVDNFVCGDQYSLVTALALDGYIAHRVIPGSFDFMKFFDFVTEDVVTQMKSFPQPRSILILNNCRIHHNEALIDLVNGAGRVHAYVLT
ncbi:uncharacterized protein EV420DRAFT_1272671 [Desarmillaria tabescens]|uniref:Tc1-like transposase DDE domain-containing protein n=1 Tax=Armillaria tabescens TaxID=1929756 RepID=A0AA39K6F3_ARMTA|nr:uncharacterized protein EV420DRAFT_1272671 [Desarmillaria tabescens]KAK0455365.1 hypothetical protein EV420DRAFT_1272671 [Desarmillaria tabescens]